MVTWQRVCPLFVAAQTRFEQSSAICPSNQLPNFSPLLHRFPHNLLHTVVPRNHFPSAGNCYVAASFRKLLTMPKAQKRGAVADDSEDQIATKPSKEDEAWVQASRRGKGHLMVRIPTATLSGKVSSHSLVSEIATGSSYPSSFRRSAAFGVSKFKGTVLISIREVLRQ